MDAVEDGRGPAAGRGSVDLAFANGVTGRLDLRPFLPGPAFDRIRSDPDYFACCG